MIWIRLERHLERKAWVASFGRPKMTPQSLLASQTGLSPYLRLTPLPTLSLVPNLSLRNCKRNFTKMTMPDSQRYPLKIRLFKYELDIVVNNFKNWLFTIVGSLKKLITHLYSENISELNSFKPGKMTLSSTLLISLRFKGYR